MKLKRDRNYSRQTRGLTTVNDPQNITVFFFFFIVNKRKATVKACEEYFVRKKTFKQVNPYYKSKKERLTRKGNRVS